MATAGSAGEDHPRGDEIRRQVEFYFSDENLPNDLHLLKCCGGRDNLPVSINTICGFRKMRMFKPKTLVVAALRKSVFLQVSADGKTIKRKIPLRGKCALDPDYHDDDEIAYHPRARKPAVFPVPLIPQQKPKYPKGTSKNMLKPTGFEDGYTESPQTPQEVAEEEALYNPEKPFVERIELAIQRFKQKRRMHEQYAHVFNKLMRFGGVESGPRMYQGLSQQDIKDMEPEEKARALAVHNVPWDRADESEWVVDFAGVGKSFLSSWYPVRYGTEPSVVKNSAQVLRSFYNYLLYHQVCPEYNHQLELARKICDTAEEELPKTRILGRMLPGDFNMSASVLFKGSHAGLYTADKEWAQEGLKEGVPIEEFGLRYEVANITFKTGIAIMGSDEQFNKAEQNSFKVLSHEEVGLDVVAIELPDSDTKAYFKEQSEALRHKLDEIEPLGKLICNVWYADDFDEWDLPQDDIKYPGGKPHKVGDGKTYEFWVEEGVLQECIKGMKLDAKVLTLDAGLTILDSIKEVKCSFFTWLPNELWMDHKPKEMKFLKKGLGLDDDDDELVDEEGKKDEGEGIKVEDNKFDDE